MYVCTYVYLQVDFRHWGPKLSFRLPSHELYARSQLPGHGRCILHAEGSTGLQLSMELSSVGCDSTPSSLQNINTTHRNIIDIIEIN
jgi:hypothetical protein